MKLQDQATILRDDLKDHPEVKKQRPPAVDYCMGSRFYQYEGTDCFQWWANRYAGFWSPYGDVLTDLDVKPETKE